jgi:intracellular septation protein
MKFLFDLLPVILFFASFKIAEGSPESASRIATDLLGGIVMGGAVTPAQAPILIATAVAIVATFLQVGWLLLRKRRVDTMLWVSLVIIVLFGGATLVFHDETFIKWKPTVLYWLFGGALLFSAVVLKKNLICILLGEQLKLPDQVWSRLNAAWIGFFTVMGFLNLFVAYSFPTDTWVSFKLFGGMGLMLAFVIAQGIFLSRHMEEPN